MDTPNLDFMVSREPTSDAHRAHLEAARAELAALRAAPPKIDGLPTVPGWYWIKNPNYARQGSPWSVHYLTESDIFRYNNPLLSDCINMRRCPIVGPLTPPKEDV